jgi:hypothetical protein
MHRAKQHRRKARLFEWHGAASEINNSRPSLEFEIRIRKAQAGVRPFKLGMASESFMHADAHHLLP